MSLKLLPVGAERRRSNVHHSAAIAFADSTIADMQSRACIDMHPHHCDKWIFMGNVADGRAMIYALHLLSPACTEDHLTTAFRPTCTCTPILVAATCACTSSNSGLFLQTKCISMFNVDIGTSGTHLLETTMHQTSCSLGICTICRVGTRASSILYVH